VATEPVSETFATRASPISDAPTAPRPWTTLKTPGGAPA
jgi:hypothetical protein